jgi:Uma2 family endonuclease
VVRYESFQMKSGPTLPGREPDLLFISNERMSSLRNSHLAGPADLVVEIISPESVHRDTVDKFLEYQQAGVLEYWLIDPLQRRATFYRRDKDNALAAVPPDNNRVYHCAVLEGFWFKVDWLWQERLPTLRFVLQEWGVL